MISYFFNHFIRKKKTSIFGLIIGLLLPSILFGQVEFWQILPNTVDDTNLEYIELRNIGCEPRDIGGYILEDASAKKYIFPVPTIIASHDILHVGRPTSKIILNNADEVLYLKNPDGNIEDQFTYATSSKGVVIIDITVSDTSCTQPTNTGSTSTESIIPPSGTGATNTGSDQSSSGNTMSGSTNTGAINPIPPSSDSGQTLSGSGIGSGSSSTGTLIDTGSTNTGTINTRSGGSTLSGSSDTGSIYSGATNIGKTEVGTGINISSGTTDTGSLIQTGSVFSGKLLADSLGYRDGDLDGSVDTLVLMYPLVLSGTVNTGALFLYSNTGGLYDQRINTETGYILAGSLSGNSIVLTLRASTIKKDLLKINNTTTSELRLKSSGNIGITSASGQELESLFLTSSFGNYHNIVHPNNSGASMNSGSMNTSSGSSSASGSTGSTNSTLSGSSITFPPIFLTFQNYTNTSLSGDTIQCTTSPCRINLTLEPIFTGGFLEKDYICKVIFENTPYETCNPSQFYPTLSGTLSIILIKKGSDLKLEKIYTIIPSNSTSQISGRGNITPPTPKNNHPPIANIDMDGKWKKYFTSPQVHLLRCYSATCSVNFTGENSIDPDGDEIRFLWVYDNTDISTSRDPGTRTFGLGTHTISFRVIDIYGAFDEIRYTIEVLSPELQPIEEVAKKEKKMQEKSKKVTKEKTTKKKKKPKKITFFDPPNILVQNEEKIQYSDGLYICQTTSKTCNINLTLSGAMKGIKYTWIYPNGEKSVSRNPRSQSLPVGKHTIILIASYDGSGSIWEKSIPVEIIKKIKPKKPKKAKKPKKEKTPKKKKEPKKQLSILQEGNIPDTQESIPLGASIVFVGGGALAYLARRRLKQSSTKGEQKSKN